MADKHGAHQTGEAYVVSLSEDFCKSPDKPVGYMISQKLDMSTLVCKSVNGCGTPVLNMSSRITNVTGNEAGVGGGVVSGVNVGMCKPVENYAPKVRAEGQYVLRHDTVMEMNTAGRSGTGNIVGKIIFSELPNTRFNDANPGEMCDAGEWRNPRKIGEIGVAVDGQTRSIPIYEADYVGQGLGPNGQYQPRGDSSRIIINSNTPKSTQDLILAHEKRHLVDDAFNGKLEGVLHDGQGNEISLEEAEARATQDGGAAASRKLKELGYSPGFGCFFNQKCQEVALYRNAQGYKNMQHRKASNHDPKMCTTPQ